jgi:adenine deaminase
VSKDLDALLPIITERNSPFIALCTDDRNPLDIAEYGHLDHMIRTAIAAGVEPLAIYRAASISGARAFGLADRGLVAPGWRADLVVIDTLEDCRAEMVISAGRICSQDLFATRAKVEPVGRHSVKARLVQAADFRVPAMQGPTPVIGIMPGRIITEWLEIELPTADGETLGDAAAGIAKIVVVERHGKNGNIGAGFVHGFGLQRGAIASTVAHDSHNICAVGVSDGDIAAAVNRLGEIEGGFVVVSDGEVLAELALPVAGLISLADHETVRDRLVHLRKAAIELGSALEEPFLQLAFLALPVIPHLKISDLGMVDVDKFKIIDPTVQ